MVILHKKKPVDYHTTCVIYMETKFTYSKINRYFKFSKTQKEKTHTHTHTFFFLIYIYFPKIDSYDNKNGKLKL